MPRTFTASSGGLCWDWLLVASIAPFLSFRSMRKRSGEHRPKRYVHDRRDHRGRLSDTAAALGGSRAVVAGGVPAGRGRASGAGVPALMLKGPDLQQRLICMWG